MSLYGKWDYKRFDIDAVKYFNNITTNGGTISATSKAYVNKFVIRMKAAGLWALMTEIYPLMGNNLAAATVKLKFVTTAFSTNHNFVSGDYVETGSGAGLTGDGSTKYLDLTHMITAGTAAGTSLGVYRNKIGTSAGGIDLGSYASTGTQLYFYIRSFNNGTNSSLLGANFNSDSVVAVTGSYITERSSAFQQIFTNGSIQVQTAQSNGSVPFANIYLMALDTYAGGSSFTPTNFSNATIGFAFCGGPLTGTQVGTLHTLITALQTSLGRN